MSIDTKAIDKANGDGFMLGMGDMKHEERLKKLCGVVGDLAQGLSIALKDLDRNIESLRKKP